MSADPHRPTTAGPTPPPSPTVTAGQSAPGLPAGSAAAGLEQDKLPLGVPADHPEYLVGAAFAGGFLAAFVLKRLGGS